MARVTCQNFTASTRLEINFLIGCFCLVAKQLSRSFFVCYARRRWRSRAFVSFINRMSPTEFSNYIKQRQQLQQHNNHYHHQANHHQNMFGAIGSVSPARSISPNPMALQMTPNDSSLHQPNPFVFPSNNGGFNLNMYQSFGSPRNMFDGGNFNQFNGTNGANDPLLFTPGKCSSFMDQQPNNWKAPSQQQSNSQSTSQQGIGATNGNANGSVGSSSSNNSNQQAQQQDGKLLDGMNSFYNSNSNPSYQHLLVAN